MIGHHCLGCAEVLTDPFLDLGAQPLANALLRPEEAARPEPRFPLAVAYCPACHLVQLTEIAPPEALFGEYLYFTSYSEHILAHARAMANTLIDRFALSSTRRVLEVASNDGYLLQFFQARGVPVLGVEPAHNVAAVATARGIPTLTRFFGPETVDEIVGGFGRAEVIVGNNVLAHVPAINEFLDAVAACLTPDGAAVFEFPYLGDTLARIAFDTVYHEHVFYYSLTAVIGLAARARLEVFDVDLQPVHGQSLRVFVQHAGARPIAPAVEQLRRDEATAGLTSAARYAAFSREVATLCRDLRSTLQQLHADGRRLAAYGAPAKATVLLNVCGIGTDLLEFTVDRSPHKQGRLIPGVRVPIRATEDLVREMPDFALLLPWNLAGEIVAQQADYLRKGGAFIVPLPTPRIIDAALVPRADL